MALGDVTFVDKGLISISGALIKAALDGTSLGSASTSGAQIFIIPTANGQQVQCLSMTVEGF